tara:strand:+ start:92 stop:592 length:501 start_codon:yes stop_codon:yes gene_type:complete
MPHLKLAVDQSDTELIELYKDQVDKHNKSLLEDPFPNAGFDLYVPKETVVSTTIISTMIPLNVKCEMLDDNGKTTGFYMYPRSSISKSPLMLANHTGIIDSGYRGVLMGAFRTLEIQQTTQYTVEKHTRLLQVCAPTLSPFSVELVDESQLSTTSRGEGGFGSTGK